MKEGEVVRCERRILLIIKGELLIQTGQETGKIPTIRIGGGGGGQPGNRTFTFTLNAAAIYDPNQTFV